MTKFIETRNYNAIQDTSNKATKADVISLIGTDEISNSIKKEIAFIESECSVEGSKEVFSFLNK